MALTGKTVLVTGATGFLGGALTTRLANEGVRVRALARNPNKARRIAGLPSVEIVHGDITDSEQMQAAVQQCEIVFHVAAALGGPLDEQRWMNTVGSRNVAQAAAAAGVMRLVHVSSIAVYGYGQRGDVDEDTPFAPGHDPYNITKAEAEDAVRRVAEEHRMPYTVIRPGQIYGPRSGMWTGTLYKLARIRPTPWVGDGSGSVFPIYVDDVVDLMITLAEHPQAVSESFNCTPDPSPTWREFLGGYARLAGHQSWLGLPYSLLYPAAALTSAIVKPQTRLKEAANILRLSQAHVTYRMTKARERLGWTAKISLQEGILRCEPWLREKGLLR